MRQGFRTLFRRRKPLTGLDPQPLRRRPVLLRKIALGVLISLVVYTIVGFFVVPPVAKHYLAKGLNEALGRPVAIEVIKMNPFSMVAMIKGLTINEPGASAVFLSFGELRADLQAESLVRRGPILRELTLTDPYVHVVRNADARTYNFSDLIEKFSKPELPPKEEPEQGARFSLNNIRILNGRIEIDDRPKQALHTVRWINIAIPFISSLPYRANDYVQPSFTALVNDAPFSLQGRTKPFQDALETSLDINIEKLNIPRYMEYVPVDPGFRVRSGSLDTRLTLTFVRALGRPPILWVKGKIELHELAMTERDGKPLLNLSHLDVPIVGINVLGGQYTFGTIALRGPEVFVRRDRDGSLNWMAFVANQAAKSEAPAKDQPAKAIALSVPEVKIDDGRVHVSDLVPHKSFKTDLSNIQAVLRGFALPQTEPAQAELTFGTGLGETVKYAGSMTLSPLASEGTLEARKFKLTNYLPYYQDLILYRLEDGIADLSTHYAFTATEKGADVQLSRFNLALASVRMRKPGEKEDFLFAKSVQIKDASLDLSKLSLTVGEFTTRDGFLNIVREQDGGINATRIMPAPKEARTDEAAVDRQGSPWLLMLKRADLQKWRIAFTDLTLAEPVKIVADAVTLQAREVSNGQGHKGWIELGATLNEAGTLTVQGPVAISPVAAELKVDVKNFGLVPLQPYFADRINILLTSADLSVAGNTKLALPPEGPPSVAFDGELRLTRFTTIDKAKSEDFLKWNTLHIGGIAYNHDPMRLGIEQVALSDFYSRIIIFPDGRLNLQGIAAQSSAEETSTAEGEAPKQDRTDNKAAPEDTQKSEPSAGAPLPPIRIGNVTLQNGDVNFTDLFIKPNYSASLTEIGGSVIGLSSQLDTTADVDLRGRFAKTAPVEIKGKINPLVQNLFLDIKAGVRDIELGPFTPYSGKFVGYAIEKGKMTFNVAYKVEDRKLAASNQIVLDQLTFGGKVESPEATKLPVLLAVALLKDRNGVIDVNLPITGSLEDPKFSIGGLIVKVIINLVTKAITSPFALIGNLVGGGGEELSYVEFDPGSAALSAAEQDKLVALQKGLADRPALKLDVTPRADPEKDREGWRRHNFEQMVKAEKFKDLVKQAATVESVDDVTVAPEEYEKYLRRAYKAAKFPKPRNAIGFVKDLPVDETEKLMLANIQIRDDDLLELANQRGQTAKDFLTRTGEVALERVFLIAPILEAAKPEDKLKGSRVDFSLK
ncbi:MAG TPA: DUF748 domain-containing protein [Burkholderiales bacterium]|nr:DUF748 domain-containing protein [Burkholderiales bacterium]